MSNYSSPTRHPVTGAIEMADWLDDHDGKHRYGVRFPSDGKIYGSRECFECTWPDLLAEIARLRAALNADAQTLRLHLGEMTAQEMRAVQAAFAWVLAEKHVADATLGDQTWGRER